MTLKRVRKTLDIVQNDLIDRQVATIYLKRIRKKSEEKYKKKMEQPYYKFLLMNYEDNDKKNEEYVTSNFDYRTMLDRVRRSTTNIGPREVQEGEDHLERIRHNAIICMGDELKDRYLYKKIISFLFFFLYFVSIYLNISFDYFQTNIQYSFILEFNSYWLQFGLDGFSIYFLYLSSFLFYVCYFFSKISVKENLTNFHFLLLLSNYALFILFFILDFFFFYLIFELILMPFFLFFILYSFNNRKYYAAYLLFFFTVIGSVFMFVFIIYLFISIGNTDFLMLINTKMTYYEEMFFSIFLFLSLIFKVPCFPFHVWLPEAHVEAPTEGSVILAGILLKLGGYGFLRFYFPIFSEANFYYSNLYIIVFLVSIIYLCCITLRQLDIKRIIAYSSIYHMNVAFIGLFLFNIYGQIGFYYMMIGHGYTSGGMFLLVGMLYARFKDKNIFLFGELINYMPKLTFFFFIFMLSNISFPGTVGFISELFIVLSICLTLSYHFFLYFFITAFISTAYNFILFNRIFLGINNNTLINKKINDISKTELLLLVLFLIHILLLGIYPNILIKYIYLTFKYYILF